MTSFIIIATGKKTRQSYAKEYAAKKKIDPFDITIIEKDSTTKPLTQSIGIEVVKRMQTKLFLKPIKSENKLVIIEDAQLLTTEAQNALLKVLEEPPDHTIIILATETREALLPTIISRCQVMHLEEAAKKPSEKDLQSLQEFIDALPNLSIGERLKKAEQLAKDKEKAIRWIEKVILVLREELLKQHSLGAKLSHPRGDTGRHLGVMLRTFQSLHTLLKTTNVNPRFAIENTLLKLI